MTREHVSSSRNPGKPSHVNNEKGTLIPTFVDVKAEQYAQERPIMKARVE